MCGTVDRPEDGLLGDLLHSAGKERLSEETCRRYTHWLGFSYQCLKKGTYNDKHEAKVNVDDRVSRFLPEYDALFRAGPCTVTVNRERISVRISVDEVPNSRMELRVHKRDIKGADGVVRSIDMGGEVPEGDGQCPLVATHDESCFKAGEFEQMVSLLPYSPY